MLPGGSGKKSYFGDSHGLGTYSSSIRQGVYGKHLDIGCQFIARGARLVVPPQTAKIRGVGVRGSRAGISPDAGDGLCETATSDSISLLLVCAGLLIAF
jgi:hypothetical protein